MREVHASSATRPTYRTPPLPPGQPSDKWTSPTSAKSREGNAARARGLDPGRMRESAIGAPRSPPLLCNRADCRQIRPG